MPYGINSMGLDEEPTRGESSVYSDKGETRVPADIRDDTGAEKGSDITWVSHPDEDYVRTYIQND